MPREMRVLRGIPIVDVGEWEASTGTWNVGPDDLAAAVEAVNDPAIRLPRIWIGHDAARDTPGSDAGSVAVGWASGLRTTNEGRTLLADFHVPPLLADTMHAHFPSRSVESWTNLATATGITHRLVIDGIALLGRELPAVETLEDIAELWGMTPDREPAPEDAPVLASRHRIVCALGRDTPAPAGPDNPRQEAPVPSPAPAEPTPALAPEAQAAAPEQPTPTPTPEPTPAPEAAAPAAPPAAPAIPEGFVLVEQGVYDDLQTRLAQVDDLVSERTEREANEYVGQLVAAGRIARASEESIAAQYREDPARTRAICDLLPEGTHDAPPVGRIAASTPGDSNADEETGVSTRLLSGAQIQRLRDRGVIPQEGN
jgi:hypothetical protein